MLSKILTRPISTGYISSLVNLRYLDMSGINITAEVLNSLQVLGHLPLLDLRLSQVGIGNSDFSLIFSDSTFASRIKHLDISWNNLEGSSPHILSNLTSLEFLDLSHNQLNGSIPLWLKSMRGLKFLDLSYTQLNASIPLWLMSIRGLEFLCLSHMSSHLSFLFSRLTSPTTTQHLDLSFNNLEGPIPHFLSDNNITDSLPNWLGKLKNLKTLNLSSNRFYGPIPPSIGNLSALEELDLSDCNFRGSFPSSIGGLSSLQSLDLSSNFLQGVVSYSHFANLSNLKALDLSFNALTLNLSSNKTPTFQLEQLRMRSCKIENQFPPWLMMQHKLQVLDLSNTGLFGKIIDWTPNVDLIIFNLSHNRITGPIPHFFPSSQLTNLDLSNNLFSGPLFHDSSSMNGVVEVPLCQLEQLELLYFQRNQLSGTISDCWGKSKSLMVIDMSSNKLSGSIPMSIALLQNLMYLILNNNTLEGTITATLNGKSNLVILDIGEIKLSGEVPHWDAESHPYLEILIMRAMVLLQH